jgi:hypothetical protein
MILVNYPRSGTHLLRLLVAQKLDYDLDVTHRYQEAKGKIITVIRDPKDAIHSFLVMKAHFNEEVNLDTVIGNYVELYENMHTNADVVIDYNTLVNDPDLVVKTLAKFAGLTNNGNEYKDILVDKPDMGYLVSSTTSNLYSEDLLRGCKLINPYDIYNKMIARKTV